MRGDGVKSKISEAVGEDGTCTEASVVIRGSK